MGDFDRSRRNDLRYSASADYDRGYRKKSLNCGAGDRNLEVVNGNVFNASQTSPYYYSGRDPTPPPRRPSPDPPFPSPRRGRSLAPRASMWCFGDPEMKRRRRVASYKTYAVEGKVKASIRKGLRWIKIKCSELVHGW